MDIGRILNPLQCIYPEVRRPGFPISDIRFPSFSASIHGQYNSRMGEVPSAVFSISRVASHMAGKPPSGTARSQFTNHMDEEPVSIRGQFVDHMDDPRFCQNYQEITSMPQQNFPEKSRMGPPPTIDVDNYLDMIMCEYRLPHADAAIFDPGSGNNYMRPSHIQMTNNHRGPFVLYVPPGFRVASPELDYWEQEYSAGSQTTSEENRTYDGRDTFEEVEAVNEETNFVPYVIDGYDREKAQLIFTTAALYVKEAKLAGIAAQKKREDMEVKKAEKAAERRGLMQAKKAKKVEAAAKRRMVRQAEKAAKKERMEREAEDVEMAEGSGKGICEGRLQRTRS